MTDEKFVFVSDVRNKKQISRSSHNKRTHCGKGGAVKFPSDFMTKKELKAMSGEVVSYRLNSPLTWKEFKALPDDIKADYIKILRNKFNVPGKHIAQMMGINTCSYSQEINRLGISKGKHSRGRCTDWDKEGWMAFVSGTTEPIEVVEAEVESCEQMSEITECSVIEEKQKTVPCSGDLTFVGKAEAALTAVAALIGGANVRMTVMWEVCTEDEEGV